MSYPTHPDKTKTITTTFYATTASRNDVIAIRNEINDKQNSRIQTVYNYLLIIAGLASVRLGITTAAIATHSSSELETLEDFYTEVLEELNNYSSVTVTQLLVGTWHGEERGYLYKLDRLSKKKKK